MLSFLFIFWSDSSSDDVDDLKENSKSSENFDEEIHIEIEPVSDKEDDEEDVDITIESISDELMKNPDLGQSDDLDDSIMTDDNIETIDNVKVNDENDQKSEENVATSITSLQPQNIQMWASVI